MQILAYYANTNHGLSIPRNFLYEIFHKRPYNWGENAVDKAFNPYPANMENMVSS